MAFKLFHFMPSLYLHGQTSQSAWFKSFLCSGPKYFVQILIFQMLICCYAIFLNFETVFDKISPMKNYIFILKKLIKNWRLKYYLNVNELNFCLLGPKHQWSSEPLNMNDQPPQNTCETPPQNVNFFRY
jgi:hypothetical protein